MRRRKSGTSRKQLIAIAALLVGAAVAALSTRELDARSEERHIEAEQNAIGARIKQRAVELEPMEQGLVSQDEEIQQLHRRRIELSYELDAVRSRR